MRPGFINSFRPSRQYVDPFSVGTRTPLESFEYAGNWPGTIADPVNYPPTFTGFSTPSNETPLESFERSAAATPPGNPPSDWPA
jgi:hypothetical protein